MTMPLPSETVNALQLNNLPTDGVFDALMLAWLPDHRLCHWICETNNEAGLPREIWDAAVACIEQMYSFDTPNGRIPTHSPRF